MLLYSCILWVTKSIDILENVFISCYKNILKPPNFTSSSLLKFHFGFHSVIARTLPIILSFLLKVYTAGTVILTECLNCHNVIKKSTNNFLHTFRTYLAQYDIDMDNCLQCTSPIPAHIMKESIKKLIMAYERAYIVI